jgi:hypothetical protein
VNREVREYRIDSPESWDVFVREAWGRAPAKLTLPTLAVSEPRLLGLLSSVADKIRIGASIPMRVFPESRAEHVRSSALEALEDPERSICLPSSEDDGLRSYTNRVRQRLGRGAALVVDNLELYDPALWMDVRENFRGLLERVALRSPQGLMAFIGDYTSTPFGVHKDDDHVFHVCVSGRKRMRVWPEDYIVHRPELKGSLRYEAFLEDAMTLEGTTGEVLYWPAAYYHVGECLGPSADFSVGFQPARSVMSEVWDELAKIVRADVASVSATRTQPLDPLEHPGAVADARAELLRRVDHVASTPRLERAMKTLWLNRKTADGFEKLPYPKPRVDLSVEDVVRVDPRFPIERVDLDDDETLCGAHGRSITLPRHAAIHALIERLNSCEPISVGAAISLVMDRSSDGDADLESEPSDVNTLLEQMVAIRALVIQPATATTSKRESAK